MFNKNIKILFIILIILIIVTLVVSFLRKPEVVKTPERPIQIFSPGPTSLPGPPIASPSGQASQAIGPQAGRSYTYSSEEDRAQRLQQETVRKLVKQLPFTGTNFTLSYDVSTDTFYATINYLKKTEGNQELNDYLKSQAILDRDWFRNNLIVR